MAWEAISWDSTVTTLIGTDVWFVAMSMHGVGFTLMTKKAGCGREGGVLTTVELAPVWFQMGVHEFTGGNEVVSSDDKEGIHMDHTRSCT